MRDCPVCYEESRHKVFTMDYKVPDNWPLPHQIAWFTCANCGMIYGDGDFDQSTLNEFYTKYYGYGVSNPDNTERLKRDAKHIAETYPTTARIVDFGGAGDDGVSTLVEELKTLGFTDVHCVGPNDDIPIGCDVIYASHVLEHIYNLYLVMLMFKQALSPTGVLIVDVPDSKGLLERWRMPILDFNTKHVNHFTLRTILQLGFEHGFECKGITGYELEFAPCMQIHFQIMNVAEKSREHIQNGMNLRVVKLQEIKQPVNVWGLGDVVWHLLSMVDLDVLNYIDNDPAFIGQTYNGKPVAQRPLNGAPIVIMAQGQRKRLIENIRRMGIENEIIEI